MLPETPDKLSELPETKQSSPDLMVYQAQNTVRHACNEIIAGQFLHVDGTLNYKEVSVLAQIPLWGQQCMIVKSRKSKDVYYLYLPHDKKILPSNGAQAIPGNGVFQEIIIAGVTYIQYQRGRKIFFCDVEGNIMIERKKRKKYFE